MLFFYSCSLNIFSQGLLVSQSNCNHFIFNYNFMMEDQIIEHFHLKVTPLQIKQNNKTHKSKKTVAIKLANKQSKSKTLNEPIHLSIPVLYSKTLNQYCPIKGIIKIYDVNEDGSEMICSVGAFQTEKILNESPSETIVTQNIGPCKLVMKIQYIFAQNNSVKQQKYLVRPSNLILQKYREKNQLNQSCGKQLESVSRLKDDNSNEDASLDVKKTEAEALGQQLILERRGSKVLQEKLEKNKLKSQLWKKKLGFCEEEIRLYLRTMKKFIENFDIHGKGKFNFHITNQRLQIPVKTGSKQRMEKEIMECFDFMKSKVNNPTIQGKQNSLNQSNYFERSVLQSQKDSLQSDNKMLQTQLNTLQVHFSEKCKEIQIKEINLSSKEKQIHELSKKLNEKNEQYKDLEALSQYLREKDTQMEQLLAAKQNTIENLRTMMSQTNLELERIESKNRYQKNVMNNLELTIEQMKEEISNLSETIEMYQMKYGDLKTLKDKALQREIKDCLRWIDQQNRDEELSLEDTGEPSVASIIKSSFSEIEHMPLEQISIIRKQIANILKKVDDLIAKNTI